LSSPQEFFTYTNAYDNDMQGLPPTLILSATVLSNDEEEGSTMSDDPCRWYVFPLATAEQSSEGPDSPPSLVDDKSSEDLF
jgi:hypothetical protein